MDNDRGYKRGGAGSTYHICAANVMRQCVGINIVGPTVLTPEDSLGINMQVALPACACCVSAHFDRTVARTLDFRTDLQSNSAVRPSPSNAPTLRSETNKVNSQGMSEKLGGRSEVTPPLRVIIGHLAGEL